MDIGAVRRHEEAGGIYLKIIILVAPWHLHEALAGAVFPGPAVVGEIHRTKVRAGHPEIHDKGVGRVADVSRAGRREGEIGRPVDAVHRKRLTEGFNLGSLSEQGNLQFLFRLHQAFWSMAATGAETLLNSASPIIWHLPAYLASSSTWNFWK